MTSLEEPTLTRTETDGASGIRRELEASHRRREDVAHRRFLRWFWVALVVWVGVVGSFNLWVDPLGLTGASRFPTAENATARALKADLIEAMDTAPEVLILGSSRAMKIDPRDIRAESGRSAFNAAVSSGKSTDFHAFSRLAAKQWGDDFPHLVVFVAAETFNEPAIADPGLARDPRLRGSLRFWDEVSATGSTWADVVDLRTAVLSGGILYRHLTDARFRSANQRRRELVQGPLSDRAHAYHFDTSGWYDWEYRSRVSLDRRIEVQTQNYAEGDKFHEFGERERRYFEEMVRLANEHGDVPTIVYAPTHPDARQMLEPYGHEQRRDDILEFVDWLATEYDIAFADLYELETFSGDPNAFHDGIHLLPRNTQQIVRYLATHDLL